MAFDRIRSGNGCSDTGRPGVLSHQLAAEPAGGFRGVREFGQSPVLNFTYTSGRFAGLMPKRQAGAGEVAMAKAGLLKLGMCVVNQGFDTSAN